MKKIFFISLAILVISFVSLIHADTIVIEPCDDMYTDVEHPTLPPTTTELWVAEFQPAGHYERIMVKFDLSQFAGQTIESATLNLNRFMGCPQGGTTSTNFYAITENWDEETWNPHTHAQYDSYVWASYGFNVNGWHNIDITQIVQSWINGDIENYGLLIKALAGSKFSKFYSKEHSNSNLHPYLEVDYTVGIDDENEINIPEIFTQNYPNPFSATGGLAKSGNPGTTIQFSLPEQSKVEIVIFNSKGEKIKEIVSGNYPAGTHGVLWNGKDKNNSPFVSGIYFYRIKTQKSVKTKKMILLR
ncbi:MAG TPA: DNRLRE domain-containing protein [Candidatus Cloacimonetes bacterium]|nr:DNRLRE domain-containing protein [Candidatus Cloacimonadota bacterium]